MGVRFQELAAGEDVRDDRRAPQEGRGDPLDLLRPPAARRDAVRIEVDPLEEVLDDPRPLSHLALELRLEPLQEVRHLTHEPARPHAAPGRDFRQ